MKIEIGKEELQLIQKALELYARVGLLQFENITICASLQKLVWDRNIVGALDENLKGLHGLFGHPPNGGPGIFNTREVGDDVRIAFDMHDNIRHHFWKLEGNKEVYSTAQNPPDICKIANIAEPKFKIEE